MLRWHRFYVHASQFWRVFIDGTLYLSRRRCCSGDAPVGVRRQTDWTALALVSVSLEPRPVLRTPTEIPLLASHAQRCRAFKLGRLLGGSRGPATLAASAGA